MKFIDILTNKALLKALEELNFTTPTQIQEDIIPLIMDGQDVLGQSQTGTGKTLAFSGPIIDKIEENKKTQTLILAPTRELAIQIASDITKYSKYTKLSVTCVYGSSSIEEQIRNLNKGSEIVIGTPGRVKDLINRKKLKLSEIKFFVLDEADEMLSMGFQEEIEYIFKAINNDKQVLLFSATMPKKILEIASKYMSNEYQTVAIKADNKIAATIEQTYYVVKNSFKLEALSRILDYYNFNKSIIFVRTKKNADDLLDDLSKKGYNACVIHGDITQAQRIKTLDLFKAGVYTYLIATDVAARGIHVNDVNLVINYNLPESFESYIHRIGRTGRNNNTGLSITLVNDREERTISELERYTKSTIEFKKLPTKDLILNNRNDALLKELDFIKQQQVNNDMINNYITELTNEEIKNVLSNLLEDRLMKKLGSDFSVTVDNSRESKNKNKNNKRELGDSVRVFLTIGKMDNIQKQDFLDFIEKKCNFKRGTCTGVEILSKFTFLNVKKDSYDKLIKNINNVKYKNKLIKVEKAKK